MYHVCSRGVTSAKFIISDNSYNGNKKTLCCLHCTYVYIAISESNLYNFITGKERYWLNDKKVPGVVDFCIAKAVIWVNSRSNPDQIQPIFRSYATKKSLYLHSRLLDTHRKPITTPIKLNTNNTEKNLGNYLIQTFHYQVQKNLTLHYLTLPFHCRQQPWQDSNTARKTRTSKQ